MENNTIHADDFDFCRPYLVNGEYIMWKGKPENKNFFTSNDILLIPFSILWCGFAFFWEISVISSSAPPFFALFGLPFIFVGLYLVFGRFVHTAYKRKRTAYVITNKKIIRIQGKKIDMLDGKTMPPIYVNIHKNGNGTIVFGQDIVHYNGRNRTTVNNFGYSSIFAIENIPNVAAVHQIINDMEK